MKKFYCRSKQQSFDYHNIIFYILLGLFTDSYLFIIPVISESGTIFESLNYHLIKALFGSSILAILIFIFPTLLEKVMKVSKHYLITIREIKKHII
jgi:hypothetical protein